VVTPLAPVTVMLKTPSAEETFSEEVAEVVVEVNVALVGFIVTTARPDGADAVRPTVPENPLDPVIVIVDEPEFPELIDRDVGLADTSKLGVGTVTATLAERNVDELLAFTATVYGPGIVPGGT
jgi:hypothetical protein